APHAILSHTLQGDVTSWNRGAERLFGYSASEMIGSRMTRLLRRGSVYELMRLLDQVKNGRTSTEEMELERQDGSRVTVLATSAPIFASSERVMGGSLQAIDIQEQVEASNRLRQALTELAKSELALRQADRRKDDFIATLAHELRNPLAPIRNAAAVLRHAS